MLQESGRSARRDPGRSDSDAARSGARTVSRVSHRGFSCPLGDSAFFSFFSGIGDRTQGLALARQARATELRPGPSPPLTPVKDFRHFSQCSVFLSRL